MAFLNGESLIERFDAGAYRAAREHALSTYPEEACGLFFENDKTGRIDTYQPCTNLQNRLHALDPQRYPRTAKDGYAMDDREVRKFQAFLAKTHNLRGFFHSHNDAGVYFSKEDLEMACPWGEPLFPECFYVVFSVNERRFAGGSVFVWDAAPKKFVEVPLPPHEGER